MDDGVKLRGDTAQPQFNWDDLEAYPTLERWGDRRFKIKSRWDLEFEAYMAQPA